MGHVPAFAIAAFDLEQLPLLADVVEQSDPVVAVVLLLLQLADVLCRAQLPDAFCASEHVPEDAVVDLAEEQVLPSANAEVTNANSAIVNSDVNVFMFK